MEGGRPGRRMWWWSESYGPRKEQWQWGWRSCTEKGNLSWGNQIGLGDRPDMGKGVNKSHWWPCSEELSFCSFVWGWGAFGGKLVNLTCYCCSVAKSCPNLHDPMDFSTPGIWLRVDSWISPPNPLLRDSWLVRDILVRDTNLNIISQKGQIG